MIFFYNIQISTNYKTIILKVFVLALLLLEQVPFCPS